MALDKKYQALLVAEANKAIDKRSNVQGMSQLEKSWQPGQSIDKTTESRLEMMRQITKPNSAVKDAELKTVYLLIDDESQATLGVYSSEDAAWAMSEELYSRYEVEAWVEAMDLDTDLLNLTDRYDAG